MTQQVSIGIDPSINSTGVCVMRYDGSISTEYYIVGSKISKATEKFIDRSDGFDFLDYGKIDYSGEKEYYLKELYKTKSIINSSEMISDILDCNSPDIVVMEGISYGSTSGASIVDLAGLNFIYRSAILKNGDILVVASPMEIKKFATGNGGVDKDAMIKVWEMCENITVDKNAKVDDLADAYFMALYGLAKLVPDLTEKFIVPKIETTNPRRLKKIDAETQSVIDNFAEMQSK
jgi:Holliday junction resolvasome RuvABC endonuclease subunit